MDSSLYCWNGNESCDLERWPNAGIIMFTFLERNHNVCVVFFAAFSKRLAQHVAMFVISPALFGQTRPAGPPPSCAPTSETQAARRWKTSGLTCSGEKREPKRGTHKVWPTQGKRKEKGILEKNPQVGGCWAAAVKTQLEPSRVRANGEGKGVEKTQEE